MEISQFWDSEEARRIRERAVIEQTLASGISDSDLFDLTFHARFANNLLSVMKREGSAVEGFQRMQQSFQESVERIRAILQVALGAEARIVTAVSGEAFNRLLMVIADLAIVKEWMVASGSTMRDRAVKE